MDQEFLNEVSTTIRLVHKTESDYSKIFESIKKISNINATYLDDNILKIICQGSCKKLIHDANGNSKQIFDETDFDNRKKIIDFCIEKGIDTNAKFGRYIAPLLFYVEDENLFEYLCSIGFNPNERLTIEGFKGRPYFSLHHDFQINIFQLALKYGFDKNQKTQDNDEIIHLIFNRFIEFDTSTIVKLSEEFNTSKNIPSRIGLTCLQLYVLRCDVSIYMIENIKKMLQLGFDKNYKTEKDVELSEHFIPAGSSAIDIFKMKCKNVNFDNNLVSIAESLLQPDEQTSKKKWWKW